ncbi:hypothetical protein KAT64_24150 [Klebsiella oxytoca]|uniref:antiviral RADAR system adenosine triphosphatase RdrA n=1 Tax=Enterobacteriaceae TaxID=543 RepID=UPI001245245F|nr:MULTISPECIES: antiviral RADAR system adenosine triphosphatase RdrA [Enterobacteriaceae]QEY56639.1 hypothetical protein FTX45_18280 [Leclercia adecarboxylata]QTV82958.1 hypothetical protein KAT64_24150 [Klebsiella oxytoca]
MSTLRFIPLDASESAVLKDSRSLLPLDVYKKIAQFIRQALGNIPQSAASPELDDVRSHNAVSIDGERGTGKTSVLVNLKEYLQQDHKDLLKDIHILKPVDPTLLEDNESLFLHIIVAALLSDNAIKLAQSQSPTKSQALNKSLESLAHALASAETQSADYGMDKLRAMFGNQHLADCVQHFFKTTLELLDKKLLVLPIDDVDTSLNRAFENLEIIRRYLTTPYVLPIVSGDRDLYREVTWRDFHGRLTKDSHYRPREAYDRAVDLAVEYQRKLLPLPRRLVMPEVSEYLTEKSDRAINLELKGEKLISLNNFYVWLQMFISGPVNGLEDSQLSLPIPSIRALTQLINHCGSLIPDLPSAIRNASDELQVRRLWQMPGINPQAFDTFYQEYRQQSMSSKRDYARAYQRFYDEQQQPITIEECILGAKEIDKWEQALLDYFRYEVKAGAVYLVLLASRYWQSLKNNRSDMVERSVLDTPLFKPLIHGTGDLNHFAKTHDFSEWINRLQGRLPDSWLSSLQSHHTILPYPVAEVGVNTATNWKYWLQVPDEVKEQDVGDKIIFLASLSMQYNFYTNAKQSLMMNIGRIFEIVVASLCGDVRLIDLQRIIQNAPFFSARALAPTKNVTVAEEITKNKFNDETETSDFYEQQGDVADIQENHLAELVLNISQWRERHDLNNVRFSPWLVYKVFNKVFSQAANTANFPSGSKNIGKVIESIGKVFYSIWSAFGSFEKGRLFGLPEVVATVNLNSPYNFVSNDHFNVNVGPFVVRAEQVAPAKSKYAASTRTASYYLADHPLKLWIEEALAVFAPAPKEQTPDTEVSDTRIWLREKLGLEKDTRLTDKRIAASLENFSNDERASLVNEMLTLYPDHRVTSRLHDIIDQMKRER